MIIKKIKKVSQHPSPFLGVKNKIRKNLKLNEKLINCFLFLNNITKQNNSVTEQFYKIKHKKFLSVFQNNDSTIKTKN